ncbi:low-affinity phosphate transporter PHO91 [Flavobacteriaceae bacterium UJ101]|nr:low-affinity phosphate transporter PHO91 [Flavobacteriaceae bacterium UJ101]
MADSRRASIRVMRKMQQVVAFQNRIISFLVSILVALLLTHLLQDDSFVDSQKYVLFLLFLSVGLWVTEAVPPFAVGIMIIGFLVYILGSENFIETPDDVQKYVNTWSSSVIWLMLGGFFLAEGMKKTGLDVGIFKLAAKNFGNKPQQILLGIMLATGLASMVMSNTATTAMMIASVTPFIGQLSKDSPFAKGLLIGIPAAASIGGMGTIIGSPPNAIAVEALKNVGVEVSFLQWMLFGFPVALLLILSFWKVLVYKYAPKVESLDMSFLTKSSGKLSNESIVRRNIVLGVLSVTMILWLTNKTLHNIPVSAVSGIPIICFTMFGIVTADDVRKLPWDTLMLVAGGLSLGLAIRETGLAEHFVRQLKDVTLNFYLLVFVFAFATVIFSNIMSNTATTTILVPIASILVIDQPLVLPLVIGLCASAALFLPVSTPPNAIAFSTGLLKQKDFRLGGIFIGVLGPVLIIIWLFLMLYFMNY